VVVKREIRGDAEGEGGLAHARPAGDHDEVPRLESRRHVVDVTEAGWGTRHLAAGLVHPRDLLEALADERLDVLEAAADAVLREVEDHLLRAVDELRCLTGPVPPEPLDLLADGGQASQRRHLANDPRVVARVRGRGHERRELVDALLPADLLELAALVELVGNGDRVDGLSLLIELERRPVDARVRLPVEVAGVEGVARRFDRRLREKHRAEDRLLGIEVLRRERGRNLPDRHHQRAVNRPPVIAATVWTSSSAAFRKACLQGSWNICSQRGRTACGRKHPLRAGSSRAIPQAVDAAVETAPPERALHRLWIQQAGGDAGLPRSLWTKKLAIGARRRRRPR